MSRRPSKSARPTTNASQQDNKSHLYFLIGIVLTLIFGGAQLLGVQVNIWFGSTALATAFVLMVRAFWIWERASRWHVALRIVTIIIAAVAYLSLVGKEIVNEWQREQAAKIEHPPISNTPPAESDQMTYMDVFTYPKPGDPPPPSGPRFPLFQAGIQPQLYLYGKNTGTHLAENAFPSSALEVHDSPFPLVPGKMMDKGPSIEIENEVWEQFEKDTKGLPTPKDTFTPGVGSWFTAATFHALSKKEAQQLQRGKKLLYVVGFIEWTDGAGTHEKRFCYLMEPPADKFLRSYVCQSHNELLRKAVD